LGTARDPGNGNGNRYNNINVNNNNWYGGGWNHGYYGGYYGGRYGGYYGGYYPGTALAWGLLGWGLGALTYSSGYYTYYNPYPAAPVVTYSGSQVSYEQPITVTAAQDAPKDEAAVTQAAQQADKAASFIEQSQAAFKDKDYLIALDGATKAVGESPGDGALHEYRALVLFALGKFSESAGVLNPVLAGGPGWNWTTMIKLYDSQPTYAAQLSALEDYATAKPKAADARFLLGYHYMVCGYTEKAAAQFQAAAGLQPADTISKQLYSLCSVTAKSPVEGGEDAESEPAKPAPEAAPASEPVPVPLAKLGGTWVADKGKAGVVTLALQDGGKFTWNYAVGGKDNGFGGQYNMNDDGLLVLDSDGNQMVAAVTLPKDDKLKFVVAGGPPGDPGLEFNKKK